MHKIKLPNTSLSTQNSLALAGALHVFCAIEQANFSCNYPITGTSRATNGANAIINNTMTTTTTTTPSTTTLAIGRIFECVCLSVYHASKKNVLNAVFHSISKDPNGAASSIARARAGNSTTLPDYMHLNASESTMQRERERERVACISRACLQRLTENTRQRGRTEVAKNATPQSTSLCLTLASFCIYFYGLRFSERPCS